MPQEAVSLDAQRCVCLYRKATRLSPTLIISSGRMTLAYFLIASLDLLGTLWSATKENERAEWIEWVWEQQLRESPPLIPCPTRACHRCPTSAPASSPTLPAEGGFRGSSFTGPLPTSYDSDVEPVSLSHNAATRQPFKRPVFSASLADMFVRHPRQSPTTCSTQANLASTYTALLLLALLRAPLNRLNRPGLVAFVRQCQLEDGSFSPLRREMQAEHDVRMVLCACVISDLLNDWDGVDVEKARAFVERCKVRAPGRLRMRLVANPVAL